MKRLKQLLCILLTAAICLVSTVPSMAAATSNAEKAKKTYESWLKKMTPQAYHSLKYDIVDLDNNKIPELLASGFSSGGMCSYVYTYDAKKGKMVRLIKKDLGRAGSSDGLSYNTKKKMFTVFSADTGGSETIFYKLKGKKITKSATYVYRNNKSYNKGKPHYLINKKKINKYSTFIKKLKKDKKGFKQLRYDRASRI